jgi:hypothetical protein
MIVRTLALICLVAWSPFLSAQEFRVLAWNVESNRPNSPPDSDPVEIGQQLTALMKDPATRAQLVALSEVAPPTIPRYQEAVAAGLGATVDCVSSGSGGFKDTDSLMLLVDKSRFQVLEAFELHRFAGIAGNFQDVDPESDDYGALRARSPLVVRLLDQTSGCSFWLIVNHLARGEEDLRTDQARMLVKWAAAHPEPIITAGDFNFDYEFRTGQGNAGFTAMMAGGVWEWIKPDPLVDSNWSDDRNVTDRRVDRYPDSMLDFVFVANQAKQWQGKATVVVRPGDFPDSDKTSDHRPVLGTFQPLRIDP